MIDPATLAPVDLSGKDLQNAPEWTLSGGFDYRFRVGPGESRLSAQYKYTDSKFNTALQNVPRSEIQSTNILDANLSWTLDGADWTVSLWATNLFDQRNVNSVFDAPGVLAIVNYQSPREYGVAVKYAW